MEERTDPQKSEAWYNQRVRYVGTSEIAHLLEITYFSRHDDLLTMKVDLKPPIGGGFPPLFMGAGLRNHDSGFSGERYENADLRSQTLHPFRQIPRDLQLPGRLLSRRWAFSPARKKVSLEAHSR